jgi:hypothetical protein
MATKTKDTRIQFGSEEHFSAIRTAYKIRPEVAKKVVKEFESGEKDWDVDYYERCKSMLSIINNPKPKAVSPRKGWKRDKGY